MNSVNPTSIPGSDSRAWIPLIINEDNSCEEICNYCNFKRIELKILHASHEHCHCKPSFSNERGTREANNAEFQVYTQYSKVLFCYGINYIPEEVEKLQRD